jgi:hypothetical protein
MAGPNITLRSPWTPLTTCPWGPTTCGLSYPYHYTYSKPYLTPKVLIRRALGTPQLWCLQALEAPEPLGPPSPTLSLVSLVRNPPLHDGVYLLSTWANCGGVTRKVTSILFSFHPVAVRYLYKRPFLPSVRPSVRPSVCPSVRPSVRPFVRSFRQTIQTPVIYPVKKQTCG